MRRQQWLDISQACNASGLTKKAWCEQNGINIKSFYYWQRQLRHETYDVQSAALSVADFSACPIVAPLVCHGVALYTVF
ncbi:MAG: hypothetical protein PUF40_01880 [Blautia massiliensis]|nr:hypothetical protein [Blautia massiliensis (ex Durand et al. 2017)]